MKTRGYSDEVWDQQPTPIRRRWYDWANPHFCFPLYNTDWLILTNEKSVYNAARTKSLKIRNSSYFHLGGPGLIQGQSVRDIMVDKVAMGPDFLRVLRLYPVRIIPPMFHTHLHLHLALHRMTNGRSLGAFWQRTAFTGVEDLVIEKTSTESLKG